MKYQIGDVIEGEITGIQPYGAFVKFGGCHYGLIHISEISKDFIKDIHYFLSVNQKIRVKILDIDEESEHFKLSLKALEPSLSKGRRRYYRSYVKLPKMDKGFKTIKEHMSVWIEEAKRKQEEIQ